MRLLAARGYFWPSNSPSVDGGPVRTDVVLDWSITIVVTIVVLLAVAALVFMTWPRSNSRAKAMI